MIIFSIKYMHNQTIPRKVLLIDDQQVYAGPYIQQLEEKGWDVSFCDVATQAVTWVAQDDWECIILDVMMPPPAQQREECLNGHSTGIWIARQIKDAILTKRIPLLIFTNRLTSGLKDEFLILGFPSNLVEIKAKVEVTPRMLHKILERLIAVGAAE